MCYPWPVALVEAAERISFSASTVRAAQENEADARTSSTSWMNPLSPDLHQAERNILAIIDSKVAAFCQVGGLEIELYCNAHRCSLKLSTIIIFGLFPELCAIFCQVDETHLESLQVIKYTAGQRYNYHMDTIDEYNDLPCGGR